MSRRSKQKTAGGARVIPFPVPPALERARGVARLGFARRGAATVTAELFQSGCAKLRLPRQESGGRREAILINTAGGLTDGDRLSTRVRWDKGASAVVTSQAAERIYRSREGPACVETDLIVGPAATALWLPQETILFDGACLHRRTEVELDPSARLLACEGLIFGRAAMGEELRSGSVVDAWRIRFAGRLIFADSFRLSGDMAERLDRPAIGGGARALATVIYVGPDAAERLELLRDPEIEAGAAEVGSSCRGPLLVTRILAPSGAAARAALSAVLTVHMARLDQRASGQRLPRVWSC